MLPSAYTQCELIERGNMTCTYLIIHPVSRRIHQHERMLQYDHGATQRDGTAGPQLIVTQVKMLQTLARVQARGKCCHNLKSGVTIRVNGTGVSTYLFIDLHIR